MKWNIDDVPVFVAVVDHNGISAAARVLGMPKSTVSTAVSRLEQALGLRLIDRNSRNLRITGEGETFYRQAQLIMEQVREADAVMAGHSAVPSGRLTAALTPAFTQEILAPRLAQFRDKFPEIELEIMITREGIELLRDRADLAVVIGPLQDSELIARPLLRGKLRWVASPAYLEKNPVGPNPEDILPHIQYFETRYGLPKMPVHIDGQPATLDLSRGMGHVNDPLVLREAVIHGAGVTALPEYFCCDQIRDGSLIEINPHITFAQSTSMVTVVYPGRRLMSPRTRVFLDFMEEACQARQAA